MTEQTIEPATRSGLAVGDDGLARCGWGSSTPDYQRYHDTEWGRPVHGESALFERITLEAFQSGLSWLTILRKRENFRAAFCRFDAELVADFGPDDVNRLLADPGIVRNRAKVLAAITNARALPDTATVPMKTMLVRSASAWPSASSEVQPYSLSALLFQYRTRWSRPRTMIASCVCTWAW